MSEIESIKREMRVIESKINDKRIKIDELEYRIEELDAEWQVLSDNLVLAIENDGFKEDKKRENK